jgi:mRNA-degrading endonuclease toxin of MazEF toxin-antitoxin module
MSYERGDVVWGPDPFKSGTNPRPWLILNNDSHPFGDEEYLTATLTTTPHDEGVAIADDDWVEGGMPKRSFVSPWAVASPKHAVIVRRQGRLSEAFVRTVVDALASYLDPPTDADTSDPP